MKNPAFEWRGLADADPSPAPLDLEAMAAAARARVAAHIEARAEVHLYAMDRAFKYAWVRLYTTHHTGGQA